MLSSSEHSLEYNQPHNEDMSEVHLSISISVCGGRSNAQATAVDGISFREKSCNKTSMLENSSSENIQE